MNVCLLAPTYTIKFLYVQGKYIMTITPYFAIHLTLQPRYVVNQVTAGDYDCPRKVLKFLTDLHAAFRMLNLRNDFLRKKFDGMLLLVPCLCIIFFFPIVTALPSSDNGTDVAFPMLSQIFIILKQDWSTNYSE